MKPRYYFVGALVLAGAALAVHTLYLAGAFRSIEPHFAGTCRQVPGIMGAEDITIHPGQPLAYISGYDRRSAFRGGEASGGLFRYALDEPDARPVKLDHSPLTDFQPHGISLYIGANGDETLFVVNHGNDHHSIEVFSIVEGQLVHQRTLTSPLLISPNDIHAISATQAYVTNDHGTDSALMKTVEDYLRLPLADVVLLDGTSFTRVADGIRYANGINQSPDGRHIYVASITLPGLHVFERDPASNALTLAQTLDLNTGPDNIEVDPDGNLWIGAHPKLLDFVAHAEDPAKLSPSQVIRISPRGDQQYRVEEVYLDDGQQLSGSSVAAVQGNRMLVGPVFDPHFLDCEFANE